MNKINLFVLKWFLCKINLNLFFLLKNKTFKKILFQYYLIFFLKYNKNLYFKLNYKMLLNYKNNFYLFTDVYNFLFNYDNLFNLIRIKNKFSYNFIFFNYRLNNLVINSSFYKNIFLNFNKNSLFFYNCINNFVLNKFVFSKFLDESFFFLILKNFKKLFRQYNLNKINKKNIFLSKVNFFKLNNFNKKSKLINNNSILYFFLIKKAKVDFFLKKHMKFSKNLNDRFFYSNIYTYNFIAFKPVLIFKKNKFVIGSKVFSRSIGYFYDFYFSFFIFDNDIKINVKLKSTNFNFNKNKLIKNYSNLFIFFKHINVTSKYLYTIKNISFYKKNNFLLTRIKNFQNYFFYKNILKSLLILNDSVYDYGSNFQNFYSNAYLFNIFNNFFVSQISNESQNIINSTKYKFFNNHYPALFFKSNFIEFFFQKIKQVNKVNTFKYIQFYLIGFFENLLKKKTFVKSLSSSQLGYSHYERLEFLFDEFKFYHLKIIKGLHVSEILEVIWLSFQNKDVYLFMTWLKKRMEKIHFKNHKKFLNLLKLIITKYSHIFLESFRLNGFFFDIRGKVGVGGNSKKRHYFFRIGKINLSSKNSKLDHQQNIVNTSFGALGVTMILSY